MTRLTKPVRRDCGGLGLTGGENRGDTVKLLFEYHCNESHDSADAELWYRSHQTVDILSLAEPGIGRDEGERADNCCPAVLKVAFADGFEGEAFEDEIMLSRRDFFRPDPPKRKKGRKL